MKEYLWTLDGGRLQYQSSYNKDCGLHWFFVPGGPGLGSEALSDLTQLLKHKIPGTIWHFDLPNDGSNVLLYKPLSHWRSALIQAISAFDKVIVVAHSTPGMYIQTLPELEEMLEGIVLIGSAPDASWQKTFQQYCEKHTDLFIQEAEKKYQNKPNNENLRNLLIACAKYCFATEKSIEQGQALFKKLPINYGASEWSSKNFDSENYQSLWIPIKIPSLIMTGSEDHITPLHLFKNNPAYQRGNILLDEIKGAGHYPWFENPRETLMAFEKFCFLLESQKIK
jgi:pimeloyl-ACP methyl ester carboxylesterase